MKKLPPNWSLVFVAGLLSVACGADDAGKGSAGLDPGTGLPLCGSDPASQPAKCVDEGGAIRCKTGSGYGGDELALCDPDPEDGQLVHMGPTDYSDAAQVQAYMLPPGGEEEFCLRVNLTNTEAKFLKAYHGRMRPYSHHLIVTETTQLPASETVPQICYPIGAVTERWLIASQWPSFDVQDVSGGGQPSAPGDPDYKLSREIKPGQTLNVDLHYANASDQPILREAWATLYYANPADVEQTLEVISFINLGIDVAPFEQNKVTQRFSTGAPLDANGQPASVYLGFTTPHAHWRMQRFSFYITPAGGTEQLVYEDVDPIHPGGAFYRDGLQNPGLPRGPGQTWGAQSGYIKINPGDTLAFECEYDNNEDVFITFGETTKQEMCNLFGFYYPTLGSTWTVVQ